MTLRILVCGSRGFSDVARMATVLTNELGRARIPVGDAVIVHGAARGADSLAEQWAKRHGAGVEAHPANWERDGKAAGPIRNQKMAKVGADFCIAFWDGQSRGTLDMIQRATRAGIPVRIVPPKSPEPDEGEKR